jgi:iron complex outermembrane receptor protein
MKSSNSRWVAVVALLAAAGVSHMATAQVPANGKEDQLAEIVVTATRRAEPLQEVPISVTAVTGDELSKRGITNYDDLVRTIPGVNSSGTNDMNRFAIRGILTTNQVSDNGAQKLVTVYLDDLPMTSFSILTPGINTDDLERVEVLRGPQGTLFGSGSMSGAIRYITKKPDARGFDASVDADYSQIHGGSDSRRISGMVNVPLVDGKLAGRVTAYNDDAGGWIDNIETGVNNSNTRKATGIRASLLWKPVDQLTGTLMFTDDTIKNGDFGLYNPALGLNKAATDIPFRPNFSVKTVSATLEYDFGGAALSSSTSYAQAFSKWNLDLPGVLSDAIPFFYGESIDTKTVVEDLRLQSKGDGAFSWVTGLYYLNQRSTHLAAESTTASFANAHGMTGITGILSPGFDNYTPTVDFWDWYNEKKSKEAALYGEASYAITPEWKATVGLRETQASFKAFDTQPLLDASGTFFGAAFSPGPSAIVYVPQPMTGADTGNVTSLTPKFSLQWLPGKNENYYVTISKGFRRPHPNLQGQINGGRSTLDPNDPTVIPLVANSDSLWNYELGAKTQWFENRLRLNASLYRIDWTNMQVGLVRPSDTSPFYGNIGKARVYGTEIELEARPTHQLDVGLNVTGINAKVVELSAQDALTSGAQVGSKLASPDFKIGGFVQYTWDVGRLGAMFARVDAQHVASYPNTFPNNPGANTPNGQYKVVPSYEVANLSIGWANDHLRATLYADNVFNNQTPIFIDAAGGLGNDYKDLQPRTVGIRVGWRH